MRRTITAVLAVVLLAAAAAGAPEARPAEGKTYKLDSAAGLKLVHVKADAATHLGRRAVRLLAEVPATANDIPDSLAVLADTDFEDGTIEAEIAGAPRAGAAEDARGFVGIAFRVQEDVSRFECFYLRPTNGRADDQLRRNHATQYVSEPEYPWYRLRKENPGVYESYVDLEPGAWTKVRIVVSGAQARLYVHGGAQPVLIVNDLKHGKGRGRIALWIGLDTEAYFSNLTVK